MFPLSCLLASVQYVVVFVFCIAGGFLCRVFREGGSNDASGLVRCRDGHFLLLRGGFRWFIDDRHLERGERLFCVIPPVFEVAGRL